MSSRRELSDWVEALTASAAVDVERGREAEGRGSGKGRFDEEKDATDDANDDDE